MLPGRGHAEGIVKLCTAAVAVVFGVAAVTLLPARAAAIAAVCCLRRQWRSSKRMTWRFACAAHNNAQPRTPDGTLLEPGGGYRCMVLV